MLSELPVILRCIASCLETAEFYVGKGNRAAADWWHNRANTYARQINDHRQIDALGPHGRKPGAHLNEATILAHAGIKTKRLRRF
jgi:hypothetical protein